MTVPQPSNDPVRDTFKEFLNSKSLRVTNQRMAIFDAAFGMEDHFTAEDLLDKARAIDSSVSRATVYRALPILTESNLIREVDVGRDYKFYAANKDVRTFQAQVICTDCEKIFEIDAPFMEWYGQTVASKLGLEVVDQRLQVSARCPGKKNGVCSNEAIQARA
ncbi:MAG: transcriptional repressor [Puniceicoccaceae bacterium MED-G30]|mgnify:FL=1|jgi:Fur family ferric uptake transcriptional regulator|nr:MAG: transcriptional repressor [Puniceicoccaceae bacterium MED-G30]RPG82933.1 MAG: transcriptional repressor [Coraliomargarita sp. TMED73]RPG87257.1 MAG: transcriptional repressor [Coraliomargarita sp. TMED73]|tara:strand:+ start:268 stop:756 length:489 start_codon:yes stop_codon:yes gene_type:complete